MWNIKQKIKQLPYPVLLQVYYTWYFSTFYPKYVYSRLAAGIPPLSRFDLPKIKTSDTVFILGSGSSINQISDQKWRAISRHDSFGFNFWVVHPHTPSLYVFEAIDPTTRGGSGARAIKKYLEVQAENRDRYASVPKIVGDLSPERLELLNNMSAAWKQNLYTLPSVPGFARDRSEFSDNLAFLKKLGVFRQTSNPRFVFKYRASLSKMISLAVVLGYERIVLCGIDLVNSDYFYQDEDRYPHMASFRSSPPTKRHTTSINKKMMVSINIVVNEMQRQVLGPRGVELFVENDSSGLYPSVPLAPESIYG